LDSGIYDFLVVEDPTSKGYFIINYFNRKRFR